MKISIIRPCAIALGDGGSTMRLEVGTKHEFIGDVMDKRAKALVSGGFAIEVAEGKKPTETKRATPKKRATKSTPKGK